MGSPSSFASADEAGAAPAAAAAAPATAGASAAEGAAAAEHVADDTSQLGSPALASQAAEAAAATAEEEEEEKDGASDGAAQEADPHSVNSVEFEGASPEAAADTEAPLAEPASAAAAAAAAADIVAEAAAAAAAVAAAAEGAEGPDPTAEATAGAAAEEEGYENLFGSGDEAQSEASLASDADLFGDDASPSAAAASAAAAAAAPAAAEGELAEEGGSSQAVAAGAPPSGGDEEEESAGHEAVKEAADSLPPQDLRLRPPWAFRLQEGASVFTWKVPPAIALLTAADAKQQQEQQQQRFAIKFSYNEEAAAQGKPAYSSNCRLVQYSDDSYCLFVDDHGFECNGLGDGGACFQVKEDVSYIFESGGAKDPLCSVFSTDRRLQVLIRAGVGADSFFYNSKKAERLQHKTQTALTTTELVEAAELAQKQAFLTRQEAARSRRAQAESQRGLTRGFLEAEDSDQEDGQGLSLNKSLDTRLEGLGEGPAADSLKERLTGLYKVEAFVKLGPRSNQGPRTAAAGAPVAAEGNSAQPSAVGCTFTAAKKVMTFVSKQQDDVLLHSVESIDPKALAPLAGSGFPAAKQRLIDSSILGATACDSTVEAAVAAASAGSAARGPARGVNQKRQGEIGRRYARDPPPFAKLHRNQMKRLSEAILHKQKTTVVKPFTFSATQQRAKERQRARRHADLADRHPAQLADQRCPAQGRKPRRCKKATRVVENQK
ncbi:hypothetical protein ACSSS7_000166 [Eimeria intestinalis]